MTAQSAPRCAPRRFRSRLVSLPGAGSLAGARDDGLSLGMTALTGMDSVQPFLTGSLSSHPEERSDEGSRH